MQMPFMIETSRCIFWCPEHSTNVFFLALLLLSTIQLPMQTVAIQMSYVLYFKMASTLQVIFQKRVRVFYWDFQTRENFPLFECLETPVKHGVRVFEMASPSAPKARVKRRTSHEPNRMQTRNILCCPSLAFDSAFDPGLIDVFRLYILFSHYRSCDDTQEI